jgi:hypothetical protein
VGADDTHIIQFNVFGVMNIKDIIEKFPSVFHKEFGVGNVTTIKDNGKYKGVGITFVNGPNYEVWFWDSGDTDKRTRYMRDLVLR